MTRSILIVDDDVDMCEMVATDLRARDLTADWVCAFDDALDAIDRGSYDVVLTDMKMPGGRSGIDLCRSINDCRPGVPVVVMTAFGSLETAVEAMRAGAYDFVTKPIDLDLLAIVLSRALRHRELEEQIELLNEERRVDAPFAKLIGVSEPMQSLFDRINRVAASDASVLICGESGTGKELVAQALHSRSSRAQGVFTAVNCASLPETLLESELFGHTKGAFTDAKQDRRGILLEADGGTLFLDEIGEMPLSLQPKLLRALEERSVRPVGGRSEQSFDIRLVTATNRDIESAVEDGHFREDLFFRINVIQLVLPPLRSRGGDIILIAQHYLSTFAERSHKAVTGISKPAATALLGYPWPGNVRELRNAIEHAVALTRFEEIAREDLPEKILNHRSDRLVIADQDPTALAPLEVMEKRYILHVLRSVGENRTLAARVLGIDRKTLYRKLRAFQEG